MSRDREHDYMTMRDSTHGGNDNERNKSVAQEEEDGDYMDPISTPDYLEIIP